MDCIVGHIDRIKGHFQWSQKNSLESTLTHRAKGSPHPLLCSSMPKRADGPGVPTRGEGVWAGRAPVSTPSPACVSHLGVKKG